MQTPLAGVSSITKALALKSLEMLSAYSREYGDAMAVVGLERAATAQPVSPTADHLHKAIEWLKRAQDTNPTGGVAWGYRARRPVRTQCALGWIGPYPETTGYIIPTMLRYAEAMGDEDALERARRMTEWELSIQLPGGGIQGGVYGSLPVAASTFVTGQVLFGLVAANERFGGDRIMSAGLRAADWLLSCLDESGRFVRGYSHFCAPGAKAYEVRTGAALAEIADVSDCSRYREAASRIADYALSMQQPNGWFAGNDLNFDDMPLTHTIGYVLEGLYEIGVRLGRPDCLDAVTRTLDAIVPLVGSDGRLPGRLRSDWSPAAEWVCLTGSSQIAGVFLRMYPLTGDVRYLIAGHNLLGFVCYTQELRPGVAGIDGGIRASYPFGGSYNPWCVLNWATKFFADSVMDFVAIGKAAVAREALVA